MIKKSPTHILLSIAALLFVLLIYIFFIRDSKGVSDALKAIPSKTGLLFEVKNYTEFSKKIRKKNLYWEKLSQTVAVKPVEATFRKIDSVFNKIPQLKEALNKKPLFVALSIVGRNTVTPLYVVEVGPETDGLLPDEQIRKELKVDMEKRYYQDAEIIHLIKKKKSMLYYTLYQGLLLASPSAILVEESIRQIDDKRSLTEDKAFDRVYKTSGRKVDANCYLHFSNFPELAQKYLPKENYKLLKQTKFFADWVELDLNMDEDKVFLSGFTHSNDSLNNYLNMFKNQSARDIDFFEVLPANTSFILSYNLSDYEEYAKRKELYFSRKGQDYNKWFNQFNEKYGFSIKSLLPEIVEHELALFYTQINPLDFSQNTFFLMQTKGKSQTLENLLPHLEHWASQNGESLSDIISEHAVKEDEQIKIYRFPSPNLAYSWLGETFRHVKSNYFMFIDDYMIFGRSIKELKRLYDQYERQAVMENDSYFKDFNSETNSESTIYAYANISLSKELINSVLPKPLASKFNRSFGQLKKFQALILQLSGSKDELMYSNIFLKYNPILQDKPRTIWESKLDTSFTFKPKIVLNHRSKEKEIFLQDLNNNIYLINRNGKILWKQQISEPIMGDVHQIDFYKNNKLQFLFNTKSRIYIIDRNGNAVERYPIMLRAKAVTGLSVFDYDKSRDYRIFVPCENKKIYLYNVEGKILPDWKPETMEAPANSPVQHFRLGILDFILASDKNRVYILNRRGEERVHLEKNVIKSNNPFFLVYKDNLPYFAGTYPDGNIFMINPVGKVFDKKGISVSSNHKVVFAYLNKKTLFDLVYVDENECKILYDLEKTKTIKLKNELSQAMVYEFSPDNKKIGLCDFKRKDLYLYNSNGELYKNFPLKGATLFSISLLKANRFNLVVGSSDGFLYNYEVP